MPMGSKLTTWRGLISDAMVINVETWDDVVAHTVPDLDQDFDDGLGSCDGHPFTLWTTERAYFPACYDGAVWVRSVPRNPNAEQTRHVGGGGGYTEWNEEAGYETEPGDER